MTSILLRILGVQDSTLSRTFHPYASLSTPFSTSRVGGAVQMVDVRPVGESPVSEAGLSQIAATKTLGVTGACSPYSRVVPTVERTNKKHH